MVQRHASYLYIYSQPFDIMTGHCHLQSSCLGAVQLLQKKKITENKASHNLGWDVAHLIEWMPNIHSTY